ncbi:SMP-30/gluconolactonase/LRE family protein [Sphingomonas sinipercae]|uniref:SMP-30/gluconolactonase/LRE family protein n=1 Tax=Sphingomonas sinipercae TaxID=2714944 RepID=A0A6G7ZLH6_9SPHN|nr:SMP-30/gluconolactonase/LRE family protein [Sphingomonas sinipercae]QIL01847.1 SMP-30/gluconolactonase/LRE family protein [Sphingomonas sinipercae]
MPDPSPARCVADVKAVLGEGPVWVAGESALYWLDIKGRMIFRLSESGERAQWETPFRVGAIAPKESGGFIAGTEHGFSDIDLAEGRFEVLFDPEEQLPGNRFNDGKTDRLGNFWAGTMDDREKQALGSLYRLQANGACTLIDEGYKVTNGPAFSPDGRIMYHNDSALQRTYAFDLDEEGNVGERRDFIQFAEGDGYPDGMTVDSQGCLWIAFWDGWCVRRISPEGERLAELRLPTARPTSCAFGGPRLDRLYVTSASIGLDADALANQPFAGGLFLLDPGVTGLPTVPFAG